MYETERLHIDVGSMDRLIEVNNNVRSLIGKINLKGSWYDNYKERTRDFLHE